MHLRFITAVLGAALLSACATTTGPRIGPPRAGLERPPGPEILLARTPATPPPTPTLLQPRAPEPPAPGSVYDVSGPRDLGIAVGLFGASFLLNQRGGAWSLVSPCDGVGRAPTAQELSVYAGLPSDGGVCDRGIVNGFDRFATRLDSQSARKASDFLAGGVVLAPFAVSLLDAALTGGPIPLSRVAEDSIVAAQSIGATLLLTTGAKQIFRRPRPLAYNEEFDKEARFDGDARLSFPSGHASVSFAAASTLSYTLFERHGMKPWTVAVSGAAYSAAAGVAGLRVAAGKHFVTDVLAGAALGTAVGLAIPWLHRRIRIGDTEVNLSLSPSSFSLSGKF